MPTNEMLSYRMVDDKLYELSRQGPGFSPGVKADIVRGQLKPSQLAHILRVLVVPLHGNSDCLPKLGHGEGPGESLSLLLAEDVDEL